MSEQNAIKIVIDTNLWISFCISTELTYLTDAIIKKRVVLCFSKELHDEIFDVLTRPKIKKYIKAENVKKLHSLLQDRSDFVLPSMTIEDCRDPKDNYLLELAVTANADYLITGDKDLLVLNPFFLFLYLFYRKMLLYKDLLITQKVFMKDKGTPPVRSFSY